MRRPIVAVDLDGTTNEIKPRLKRTLKAFGGERSPAFHRALHEPEKILRDRPVRGASRGVKELARSYEVHYVSGRIDSPETRRATRAWLKKHGFPGTKVHLRPAGESVVSFKTRVLARLKPQLSIGDRPDDAEAARRAGVAHVRNAPDTFPSKVAVRRATGRMRPGDESIIERAARALGLKGQFRRRNSG